MMFSHSKLYLVTRESAVSAAVCGAIGVNGEWSTKQVCTSVHDLTSRLPQTPRAIVIIDIDPEPENALAELDILTRRFSETRFVVVSQTFSSELVLGAMQAGARHFMLKTSIAADLTGVIRRLGIEENRANLSPGEVITLLSAGGGCGATTLAVNLAAELHQLSSEPVLMVDLDEHYGTLGAYLGVKGQYGIADVLGHRGRIDPQLITSTAEAYSQGLQVLLSPAGMDNPKPISDGLGELPRAIEAAQLAYGYTVVDAPRIPMDAAARLARMSLLTIIVFQLSVKDIRGARNILGGLTSAEVPAEQVMLVANRYRSRHGLVSLAEAANALGTSNITCIENDYKGAIRGADYGKPLAEIMPRSALRKSTRKLAEHVVAVHGSAVATTGAAR